MPPPLRGRWIAEGETEGIIGAAQLPPQSFASQMPAPPQGGSQAFTPTNPQVKEELPPCFSTFSP